jgi:phage tail protein X
MLGLLWLVFASTPAAFHLEVSREGATKDCPPSEVRARVVALLGRDPFGDAGPDAVRFVVTTRSGPRWTAVIQTSGGGNPAGVRRLRAPSRTCAALDETVALALALAVDPLAPLGPPGPAGPDGPVDGVEVEPPVDTVHIGAGVKRRRPWEDADAPGRLGLEPARQSRASRPTGLLGWRLGVAASTGYAPELALGPELGVRLGAAPWRVELGARVPMASARVDGLVTAVVVWALHAEACYGGRAAVCVGLEGGVYSADAGRAELRPHLAPGLALKLGEISAISETAEGAMSRTDGVGGELVLRLSVPLWRQRWDIGGEPVWRMPSWLVGLAMGVTFGAAR